MVDSALPILIMQASCFQHAGMVFRLDPGCTYRHGPCIWHHAHTLQEQYMRAVVMIHQLMFLGGLMLMVFLMA